MRQFRLFAAALLAAALLAPAAFAQPVPEPSPPAGSTPSNDQYSYATPIQPNATLTQDTTGATRDRWEPTPCFGDTNVWFHVEAYNATRLRIEATASARAPSVALYRWYPGYESNLGCAFGANGTTTVLEKGVLSGSYYVEVSGNVGDLALTVTADDSAAPYELTAPYIYLASEAVVGDPTEAHFAVQSLGRPIHGTVMVAFYLDGWWIGDQEVEMAGSSYVGSTFTFTPWWEANSTLSYYVDSVGAYTEMTEWDNSASTSFTVLPRPDLTVEILDLKRVPLRTELGDLRHPLALWEVELEVCNRGGGYLEGVVDLTMQAGGEHSGGTGSSKITNLTFVIGSLSCFTWSARFSTANAVGDFTVVAIGTAPRDSQPWNNEDRAYGFNVVAETFGLVVSPDGLLP